MKYLMATTILFFSLFLGWFFSAKYLEPILLRIFKPATHETYLDIWFSSFVLIELIISLTYFFYIYKTYKSDKQLTKVNAEAEK